MKVETNVEFEFTELVKLLTDEARKASGIKSGGAQVTMADANQGTNKPSFTVHLTSAEPKKS